MSIEVKIPPVGESIESGVVNVDPDLSMFTKGGGGAHCLAQALRRAPGG